MLRVLKDGRCVADSAVCFAYECFDAYATTAFDDAVAALFATSPRPQPPLSNRWGRRECAVRVAEETLSRAYDAMDFHRPRQKL